MANGKIVATGFIRVPTQGQATSLMVARFLADGRPDPAFGGRGRPGLDNPDWWNCRHLRRPSRCAVLSDGRVVVGRCSRGTSRTIGMSYGTPRAAISTRAFPVTAVPPSTLGVGANELEALRIQPDGKIVVAGTVGTPVTDRELAARPA